MEKEERKAITAIIGKMKRKRGELDIIEKCITTAFEEGRITEAEYYRLYYKY